MPSALESSSFQTTATDSGVSGILDATVTGLQVLDPTEGNEQTTLLEVDDEFDVLVTWQLTGTSTTTAGGFWLVSLYSDDIDGVGAMTGLLATSPPIPIVGAPSPLNFQYLFKIVPPTPQVGLYDLVVTINHSPTGNPAQLSEMYGFAESTPINIRSIAVETAVGAESA